MVWRIVDCGFVQFQIEDCLLRIEDGNWLMAYGLGQTADGELQMAKG
jgi:hypothetical protein